MTLKTLPCLLIFSLSLAVPTLGSSTTKNVQRRNPTPQAILRRMAQVYSACSSYDGSGIVITTYDEETKGRIVKKPFKLLFKRPDRFRFEWIDYGISGNGRLYVVWSHQAGTFTYREPDTYEKEESLSMGIAGATGISSGAASNVPRLLMPDLGSSIITRLRKLTLLSDEIFEGELCYHIRGSLDSGDLYELWISKKDYLLRKMRSWGTYSDYSTVEDEIHRNVKTNRTIPDERLDFRPPIALRNRKDLPEDITKLLPDLNTVFEPDPALWSEFASEEGRFKIFMPSKPTAQTLTLETSKGKVVHHSFVAKNGGILGLVDYADLPNMASDSAVTKELFDEVRNEFLKQLEAKLQAEKSISIDGHPGREIRFTRYHGQGTLRCYLVNDRLYQLAIIIFTGGKSEAHKFDADITRFFDSFQITTKTRLVGTLRFVPFETGVRQSFENLLETLP